MGFVVQGDGKIGKKRHKCEQGLVDFLPLSLQEMPVLACHGQLLARLWLRTKYDINIVKHKTHTM
jgi:hypothetical protein